MKKILFLGLLTLAACGVEYDAETRLVAQTRLVDSQGHAIVGKQVEVWVSDNGVTDKISNGVTDNDGALLLIFPAPNNMEAPIDILFPPGTHFEDQQLRNIKRADFTDYKLTLDNLVLYHMAELTNLSIELVHSSGNTLVGLGLENNPGAQYVFWNPIETENFVPHTYHRVAKNTTVELVYKIRNTAGVESTHTIPLAIGNDAVTYTLAY